MLRHSTNRDRGGANGSALVRIFRNCDSRIAQVLLCLSILCGIGHSNSVAGEDEPAESAKDALADRRLESMQSAIDDFEITPPKRERKSALRFSKSPLLRYSDQTRELLDAGVWRLGETGRPTAIVTLEIYDRPNVGGRLVYEFVSLTPVRFSIVSPRGPQWAPSGTDLNMMALSNAPSPADS
jgi:hypothetical protein